MDRIVTLSVDGKTITFNEQQVEALDKIHLWLKSNKQFFTLSGAAGTGKSTIIKKIFEYNLFRKQYVCVSAPTHTAKKIVAKTTGQNGKTIQSLLGLRPDVQVENFLPNFPEFNVIAPPTIADYKFVVIDEASMINKHLFKLIKELVLNSDVKVLFVGDEFQIPPVGEELSVVFHDINIEKYHLTKVERQQDGNPLMPIYDKIRDNLDNEFSGFERISNINNKGEGVEFFNNRVEFRKKIMEHFTSKKYKDNPNDTKLIAWTNDAVVKSNLLIRSAIYGDDVDLIEINDVLFGYRTISDKLNKFNIIENSTSYTVIKRSGLVENKYGLFGFDVTLCEEIDDMINDYKKVFIINSSDYNNLHNYAEKHDELRDNAVRNKKLWVQYYNFRRESLILTDIDKFRNGVQRQKSDFIKKDLDYGWAITAHKSQGSTLNTVFLLENDIMGNWNINERNRILYVAMSRPTKCVYSLSNFLSN